MAKKITQIQFTPQQLEQLEDLKRQTGLTAPSSFGRRSTTTLFKSGSTVISRP